MSTRDTCATYDSATQHCIYVRVSESLEDVRRHRRRPSESLPPPDVADGTDATDIPLVSVPSSPSSSDDDDSAVMTFATTALASVKLPNIVVMTDGFNRWLDTYRTRQPSPGMNMTAWQCSAYNVHQVWCYIDFVRLFYIAMYCTFDVKSLGRAFHSQFLAPPFHPSLVDHQQPQQQQYRHHHDNDNDEEEEKAGKDDGDSELHTMRLVTVMLHDPMSATSKAFQDIRQAIELLVTTPPAHFTSYHTFRDASDATEYVKNTLSTWADVYETGIELSCLAFHAHVLDQDPYATSSYKTRTHANGNSYAAMLDEWTAEYRKYEEVLAHLNQILALDERC